MMLKRTIHELTTQFVEGVLRALKGATLDDIALLGNSRGGKGEGEGAKRGPGRPPKSWYAPKAPIAGPTRRKKKRLRRRSGATVEAMVARIVSLVGKHRKNGIGAKEIKESLGIERRELPRPLGLALASRKIKKSGRRSATVYRPM